MNAKLLLIGAAGVGILLGTALWWRGSDFSPPQVERVPAADPAALRQVLPSTSSPREPAHGVSPDENPLRPAATRPVVTRLTSEMQEYLERGKPRPPPAAIPRVAEPLLSELLSRLENTSDTKLLPRLGSLLLYTPEERVVTAFIHKLTNGFAGQRLNSDQAGDVASLCACLGMLARERNSALDFLKQATSLSFWAKHRKWTLADPEITAKKGLYANMYLAGRCWSGLGFSGRPEALEFMLEYRSGQRHLEGTTLVGAVVEAAFFWHEYQDPTSVLLETKPSLRKIMDRFTEWLESEDGKAWQAWSDRVYTQAYQQNTRQPGRTNGEPN